MAGLVEEIQRDALNPEIAAATLLRKVKVAASKLKLGTVEEWVQNELNGYKGELPEYRILYGRPEAFNPHQGWIPILMPNRKSNDALSRCPVRESVSSLELTLSRCETSSMHMPLPTETIRQLNRSMDVEFGKMGITLVVSQVQSVVEAVRNAVLDWALELERAGLTGQGFSFNDREMARAKEPAVTYNIGSIGSFAGNLGQGNTSGDITLNVANWSELRKFAEQVESAIPALQGSGTDVAALASAVAEIEGRGGEAKSRQADRPGPSKRCAERSKRRSGESRGVRHPSAGGKFPRRLELPKNLFVGSAALFIRAVRTGI